ncbi:MAG TPA: DUF177 domain-containing protein [Candidatus Sulfotelmatobacter sp.]|nr:DUF177 domain-containing protein [Candidatus Sulfotelmatobacter sp.]
MKIDLTELLRDTGSEADVELEQKLNFAEDGLVLAGPVKVKLHLTNTGASVLVKGMVRAVVEQECSRCLKKFSAPLTAAIDEEYTKEPDRASRPKKGGVFELKEQDFVYPIGRDNTLDLGETIRQNLLLDLPLQPRCRPDCTLGVKGE